MNDPGAVLYWYDFICPFCYVARSRNAVLARQGLGLVKVAFEAHPDIPEEGIAVPPRKGPMYAMLEREAGEAGLELRWPPRLPNSGRALATAEWVRCHEPHAFPRLHDALFEAHFVLGQDIGEAGVIDGHASRAGVDLERLHSGFADGSVTAAANQAVLVARQYGVHGTPTWRIGERLIEGLVPSSQIGRIAAEYVSEVTTRSQEKA